MVIAGRIKFEEELGRLIKLKGSNWNIKTSNRY